MSQTHAFVSASAALPCWMVGPFDAGRSGQLWPMDMPVVGAEKLTRQYAASSGLNPGALTDGEAAPHPARHDLPGNAKQAPEAGLSTELKNSVLDRGAVNLHIDSVACSLQDGKQFVISPVIKLGMDVWKRIEDELHRRRQTNAWFGRKMDASRQVVAGWKKRGVPPAHHEKIALLFGWTIDRLVYGVEDAQQANEKVDAVPTPAPLPAEAIYSPMALEIARTLDKISDLDKKRHAYAMILQLTALDSAPSPKVPEPTQSAPADLTTPTPQRVK